MSFVAPVWLWAALAAAAAVVAMHFFARQRPRPAPLPTARFVPDLAARAPSPAARPSDVLLMVLRVLALLAAGLGLARPVRTAARQPLARVVVVAADEPAALDSARAYAGAGDTLLATSGSPSLSSAFIAAVRAASAYRDRADSLELVVVSDFAVRRFDAATDSIRRLWLGRARLVRIAAPAPPAPRQVTVAASGDDPLLAAAALLGERRGAGTRVVRAAAGAGDSAFARAGGVLVVWPREPAALWPAGQVDTIGAVVARNVVVVAPFVRAAELNAGVRAQGAARPAPVSRTRVVARWVDGRPAALERPLGEGCVREVAVPVPVVGDLVLRASFVSLVDRLTDACGDGDGMPADSARVAALRSSGPLMPAGAAAEPMRASRAALWLLGVAALILLAEMAVRRRGPSPSEAA